MYLFHIFRSFLPMRNPIGFGGSDFVVLALAILMCGLLAGRVFFLPYARRIAERTPLCMGLLFGLAIVPRLLLLASFPVPIPAGADDFSYVLLGDTLRHLRMANPPHSLHQFFEAVFVLQQPTYASIYPLGQGLVLALGWMLLQSFWAGVLISGGGFCALCYWMLRAWVPPVWALLGGLLSVIQFGPLNPWMNSYWGGYVSACAGCLVFGSLPRNSTAPLGTGLALQLLTRPFEAVFLTLAAVLYRRPRKRDLAIAGGALILILLQNRAVTHSWTTMPYMASRFQYGVPTTFTFQAKPVPHASLTPEQELDYRAQSVIHDSDGFVARLAYRFRYLRFFLLPPLFFAVIRTGRRYVWAVGTVVLFVLGTNFYPYFFPHYVAAITCLVVLLCVAGLQRLERNYQTYIVVLCCTAFVFWFGVYFLGGGEGFPIGAYQTWYYVNPGDPQSRASVQAKLDRSPGQQLVFVRYSATHRFEEWVHNAADIDAARTVWANDLGADENRKLLGYYPNRTAWLLEPDMRPPALIPYPKESGTFETVH